MGPISTASRQQAESVGLSNLLADIAAFFGSLDKARDWNFVRRDDVQHLRGELKPFAAEPQMRKFPVQPSLGRMAGALGLVGGALVVGGPPERYNRTI
jgi:hypothetical protein